MSPRFRGFTVDSSPVEVVKDVGEDEVEERPELCQVVL